jgi:hypothetical protein
MAEFDPSTAKVDEVLKKLEKADEPERQRILNAERAGQARKTILEEYGIDPDARVDGSGRTLYPWEVKAEDEVRRVEVEETDEQRQAREAQAEYDRQVAAARPQIDEQGGGAPLGAPGVAGTTAAGATGGTTAPGTAGGAAVPTSGNTSSGAPTT